MASSRSGTSGVRAGAFTTLLIGVLVLSACATPPESVDEPVKAISAFITPQPTLTPPSEPEGIVLAWIECEDQCEAQLEAVLALGDQATPILVRTLTEGPPTEQAQAMKAHLDRTYKELATYAETHPEAAVGVDQAAYVALYLDNYQAQYQTKSAQALVAIGGPEARDAILRALRAANREDVRQALERALEGLGQ